MPDEREAEIEDLIFSQKMEALRPVDDEVGKATRIDDVKGRYIVFLKNSFPKKYTLDDQGMTKFLLLFVFMKNLNSKK